MTTNALETTASLQPQRYDRQPLPAFEHRRRSRRSNRRQRIEAFIVSGNPQRDNEGRDFDPV